MGSDVIHQELHIDQSNGNLYVAFVEESNNRVTVKKWINNTWVTQGNANFGTGSHIVDVKMATALGQPYVATKYKQGSQYFIKVYRLSAGVWTAMGSSNNYMTPELDDWGFKSSMAGELYLSFYNLESNVGDVNALITLKVQNSAEAQYGGIISTSYVGNTDMAIDNTNQVWSAYEYPDVTNYVNLSHSGSSSYVTIDVISGYPTGKMVTNLADHSTDFRFGAKIEGTSPYLACRRYDLNSLTGAVYYNVHAANVDDFDMASDANFDYFFYNIGSTHTVEKVSATGVETTMGSNFGTGSGTVLDPRIEVWNDRIVVSFLRDDKVRVMEINNDATVTLGSTFDACESVQTTALSPSLTVSDNNYSQAGLQVHMHSMMPEVQNSDINVVGSYPEYYLQFTSESVSTLTNVGFEFTVIENGNITNTDEFYVDVIPAPEVNILLTDDQMCTNESTIMLSNFCTPAGGFWSGTGISSSSKFNPATAGLGTHTLTYTYYNAYGCAGSENFNIAVHPVPQVSVSTIAASCGENDGEANATITGGTPGYSVYWSNGLSTEDITELYPGMYFITVVDDNGCEASKPAAIASTGVALLATSTNVICHDGTDGAIDLDITAPAGIASIKWSNGATTEDISNLKAGAYEVMVTANDGCISTASFEVGGPEMISLEASTVNAGCGASDGSATCLISGGSAPYDIQWYKTSTGATVGTNSQTLDNVSAGAYHAVITDSQGCSVVHHTAVNNESSPDVSFIMLTPAGCFDDGAIDIDVNSDSPIAGISWNSGQTTEDITGLSTGTYSVEVMDENGCVGVGLTDLPAALPAMNPLCLVTVDTLSNTNLLVWEKPVTTEISHFNIYRETSVAGVFQFIDSVLYDSESVFNDLVASPSIRSWRYRLSAVNMCGQESDLSEFHKTIHLAINLDLGGEINISWDDYEGFPVGSYDLYRHTNATGWELIQQMPSNLFTYQDTPPTAAGLDYMISVEPPSTCTSTLNKAQDHNSSRSNKTANGMQLPLNIETNPGDDFMSIFPNPSTGVFTLQVNPETADSYQVIITDIRGQVVMQFSCNTPSTTIDLADFSDGIYNLQLLANDSVINRKLSKQ